MSNFIQNYYKLEKINTLKIPIYFLKSFSPITFKIDYFPIDANHKNFDKEIKKFPDIFHTTRFEKYLNQLKSFSNEEIILILNFLQKFEKFRKKFGIQYFPLASILSSIMSLRAIKLLNKIYFNNSKLNILDVGSGSGILPVLLYLQKNKVYSYEVTPSLFFYQNKLYENYCANDYIFLTEKIPSRKKRERGGGEKGGAGGDNTKLIHIPWWFFYYEEKLDSLKDIDVINFSHCFMEITTTNILYLFNVLIKKIIFKKKNKVFIVLNTMGAKMFTANISFIDSVGKLIFLDPIHDIWIYEITKNFKEIKTKILRRKILNLQMKIIERKYNISIIGKNKTFKKLYNNSFNDVNINEFKEILFKKNKNFFNKSDDEKYFNSINLKL